MLFFQLLLLFSLYIIFICAGFIQDKLLNGTEMHLDRFDTNCGGKNTPIQIILQGVKTTSTKLFVKNITLNVKEGKFKKFWLTIIVQKCRSKENLDTCEQLLKQEHIDLCKAIDPDNPIVTKGPFYAPFEPPLKCPISKGIYRAHNVSIDVASLIAFTNFDSWYWRVKNEVVSEENKFLFCILVDAYFTNSKSKRHPRSF